MEDDDATGGLGFPVWLPVRRRFKPDDPFFAAGNIERELLAKQVALDINGDQKFEIQKMEDEHTYSVFCPIVGCKAALNCLEDFEDHYNMRHMASCSVCSMVFPTSRLLSIHVSETHDSFFQAKVARGFPMYECLVEGCGAKLKSYKSRQQHLVDKHKFPVSFQFYTKAHPSKHQRQRHQQQKAGCGRAEGKKNTLTMDVEEGRVAAASASGEDRNRAASEGANTEMEIDDLVSKVSKLSTSDLCPSSVSFGHRHSRGLMFRPRSLHHGRKPESS